MNGADDGDRTDDDGSRPPGDRDGSADAEGGFEFGPDQRPVEDEPHDPPRDRESTDERRIKVDLATDEPASDDSRLDDSSPDRDPDPDRDPFGTGPDPGPNADRNWTALLVALALTSVGTGAFTYATHDDMAPVVGVMALGAAFAALVVVARASESTVLGVLSAGWVEHRRYTWFAVGLFAFGTLLGILLLLAGVNLLELIAELLEEELFPELEDEEFELTATFFITNNTQPFVLSILGALSLGLVTAIIMIFNGIIVGNVSAAVGSLVGVDYIIVGLAPHGIFELPALFIAAGVGFRIIYRFGERLSGSRDAFFTKSYVTRTVALVIFAWLLLVLAAFVEAYVTPELLEMLFADRLEGIAEEPPTP